jgi:hypothetical protein
MWRALGCIFNLCSSVLERLVYRRFYGLFNPQRYIMKGIYSVIIIITIYLPNVRCYFLV